MPGVKNPIVDEYENALKVDMNLNKKIIKLVELNELAYVDLVCPSNIVPMLAK